MEIILNKKVSKQIQDYVKYNSLNLEEYVNGLVRRLVTIDAYGELPAFVKHADDKISQRKNKKENQEIEEYKKKISILEKRCSELETIMSEIQNKKTDIVQNVEQRMEELKVTEVVKNEPKEEIFIPANMVELGFEPVNNVSQKGKRKIIRNGILS
jgi:TolA-binding protein